MQQAATLAQQAPSSAADGNVAPGALRNAFVINLTSSTTPVALTRPEHAGLRRFTFFVSRRREEGRERFRLHMGYFDTQEEAEKLLDIVREIYPGAWAGLTPGRGLRGTPAVAQPPDVVPAAAGTESLALAPTVQPPSPSRGAVVTPITALAPAPAASIASPRAAATPTARGESLSPDRRTRIAGERPTAAQSLDTVREAIDALEDSAGAAAAAAMLPRKPRTVPTLRAAAIPAVLAPTVAAPLARAAATGAKSTPRSATPAAAPPVLRAAQPLQPALQSPRAMSERAVLELLEAPDRAAHKPLSAAPADEKPSYAVQLAWSAEPIELARVPQLAIFSAYTLYGAQGHRDGRRWYGLRLGFFTDVVSAKQVAQYVRADFATVAVVPVSCRERDQAKHATAASAAPKSATVVPVPGAARPARTPAAAPAEFKFIDDAAAEALPRSSGERRAEGKPRAGLRPGRGAPGKRAVFRAGRIHATSKAKQMTLEETLEILGANDLEVSARNKKAVSAAGVAAPAVPAQGKPSKLSRLFERLSERMGT